MANPTISVLMPVFNCEPYIAESVSSILSQTFEDFELIIIDDASTDKTVEVIESFKDSRIQLIRKPHNSGYTNSLNMGLRIAGGKYIARMDGDDISYPDRFRKQLDFFQENPEVIVCGTNYRFMKTGVVNHHPSNPEEVKVDLLSGCYVAHPTVMFKREVLTMNSIEYNPEYEPAEDYNLWVELSQYGLIGNLSEVLLDYRTHDRQVSNVYSERQQRYTDQARLKMVEYLVPCMNTNQKKMHLSLMNSYGSKIFSATEMKRWKAFLLKQNYDKKIFNQKILTRFLSKKLDEYVASRKESLQPLWKRGIQKLKNLGNKTHF